MTNDAVQEKTIMRKIFSVVLLVVKSIFDLILLSVIAFIVIFFYTYYNSIDATQLTKRSVSQTTVIYDRTGEHILYKIHGEENRKVVRHDAIPDALRNATVSIEDERFYNHIGVDVIGILRAMRENFAVNDAAQGGSTITQQLVRNAFLTREKTITRKFKEIVLAIKIERTFSKEEILDLYLNEVPYGSNAYGAEAAADVYFGKRARDLTIDEAALIAALPKATTYYSPYGSHKDDLLQRQNTIIRRMGELGYYDSETVRAALREDTLRKIQPFREEIDAPHFVFYIREQLEELYGSEALEQGGYKIYTTLDYDMQKRAETIVKEYAKNLPGFGASNASLVAVDPKSGAVRAMVGSIDYYDEVNDGNVNVALQPRQPGSSFKPIVYAAAFEKGYQPETLLYDVPTSFGKDGSGTEYKPNNFDGKTHGLVSMRKAIQGSLNIPAVKTLYLVGKDNAIDFAEKLGISTLQERNRYGLSLVLGGAEVKLVDQVGAFAVFANDGMRAPVHGVDRVTDPLGQITSHAPEKTQVIDAEVARKINNILIDNDARSYVFGRNNVLYFPDRSVAAKTGTTQEFRDAWTVGYTPSLAVGVWVGNNDGSFMNQGSLGSKVASPLWRQFIEGEIAGTENEAFPPYQATKTDKPMLGGKNSAQEGSERYIKIASGKAISATKASKLDADEYRIEYTGARHSILHYVNKDNPLDENIEPNLSDPMYRLWEAAINGSRN